MMDPPTRTIPPGRYVVFYDGACRFCTAGAKNLAQIATPGQLELIDFQATDALTPYPGLTYDMCMEQMYLVTPDGRVFGGVEAIVQTLATRTILRWTIFLYYLPVLRWIFDALYQLIAAQRYRIMGKQAQHSCDGGTCKLHFARNMH